MDRGEKLIKKPSYPGGRKAMDAFIKSHMQYPEAAELQGIEGTVAVKLDIDENGKVMRTKIKKGLGHGCDEEAMRLCSLLKFKTAAKRKNQRITFHRTINIHFRIPKKMKRPEQKKALLPEQGSSHSTAGQTIRVSYSYVKKS